MSVGGFFVRDILMENPTMAADNINQKVLEISSKYGKNKETLFPPKVNCSHKGCSLVINNPTHLNTPCSLCGSFEGAVANGGPNHSPDGTSHAYIYWCYNCYSGRGVMYFKIDDNTLQPVKTSDNAKQ